jgi:predicted metal-dependent peptidase
MSSNLSAKDRIVKVRINFLREHPFFANVALYLDLVEDKHFPTMGVNAEGELRFNPDFVNKYDFRDLKMIIAHETLHLALLHLVRVGNRDKMVWNFATDIAINNLLEEQGFHVPNEFLKEYKYKRMSAEEIYDILIQKAKKIQIPSGAMDGKGFGMSGSRFDVHNYPKMQNGNGDKKDKAHEDPNGKPMTSNELNRLKDEWKRRIVEAETIARQMGKMPSELERLFGKIIDSKINWKALLYRYITQEIPCDSTYARPSRRSESVGFYMPYTVKENIDITVAIDSSGSITEDDMTDFMSEVIAIAKSFASIKMTVIVCDAEIHSTHEVSNGFSASDIKLSGGCGTNFKPVFSWIMENKPSTKLLIYLTDGYGDFPSSETVKTLWVMPNDNKVPFGEKIIFKGD